MKSAMPTDHYTATQNACNLCAPLGAALVFKGIANSVPLLHGSQGCSTYIRRYLISHFKEPMDIACSNFGEDTAIFGGGAHRQAVGQALLLHGQAVVAHGLEGFVLALENLFPVACYGGGFSMHEAFCGDDASTESHGDGLMTQAHPEQGNFPGKFEDCRKGKARGFRAPALR